MLKQILKDKIEDALDLEVHKIGFEKIDDRLYYMEVVEFNDNGSFTRHQYSWTIGDGFINYTAPGGVIDVVFNRKLKQCFQMMIELTEMVSFDTSMKQ